MIIISIDDRSVLSALNDLLGRVSDIGQSHRIAVLLGIKDGEVSGD